MRRNNWAGWIAVACLIVSPVLLDQQATAAVPPGPSSSMTSQRVTTTMMGMPLQFEANHGQVDDQVKFLSRGSGYTLFLTPTESVMVLQQRDATANTNDVHDPLAITKPSPIKQSVVRMKLEGANPSPSIDGMEQLPGIVNYFIGNDPAKWRTKIPTYAKVQYKEAYPGIDLAYYGNQGKLEYDFIVAPGADPSQIKLAFEGASTITVANSGDLLLTTALGEVRLQKPVVYQLENDGHKTLVAGNYVAGLSSSQAVRIQLAAYDRAKPLVIDPTLMYSTYLGGSANELFENRAIGADSAGNAYVVAETVSLNFPVAGVPFQGSLAGTVDPFVTKINAAGSGLLYSTYLGGSGNDTAADLDVDAPGNVYITGDTCSADFPVTAGSLQTVKAFSCDAYVTKINSAGSGLLFSTFLGGNGDDVGRAIAVDSLGRASVAGWTQSTNFPGTATSPFQSTLAGGRDAFWATINSAGNGLVMSSYYGGSLEDIAHGIAVDSTGNVYITGYTFSTNLFGVSAGSLQPSLAGAEDAFVAKFNLSTSTLAYSTYLGGIGSDRGNDIVADGSGNSYVTGSTRSSGFPIAGSPVQPTLGGNQDVFVSKLNNTGSSLVYSTFLGSAGDDVGSGIAVDSSGNTYVAGGTRSLVWPGASGSTIQPNNAGFADAFVTKLNPTGASVLFSTFLGGSLDDNARGVALDGNGNVYVAGDTASSNFHTQSPYQAASAGGVDAWVAKISDKPLANAGPDQSVNEGTLVTLDGTGSTGGSLTYQWTQVSGPAAALGGANTANPTFTAPHVSVGGGTVTFNLVVCEGSSSNCGDPDTINVHIINVNHPPVAQAGPDQTVQEGSPVMLDGTASYDPDVETLSYQWTQLLGPAVTLLGSNTETPTFVAPSVGSAGATIVFDLTVTDPRTLTGSDSISVFVTNINQSPTANAGPSQTVNELTVVTLNGAASSDPDLDPLTFAWSQVSGPSVILQGANTVAPTFTAPNVGPGGAGLTFKLVVSDGQVSSAPAQVTVNVQDVNDLPVCSAAKAKPKLLWPPNHKMVKVKIRGISQGTSGPDDDDDRENNEQAEGADDHGGDDVQITITSVTQDEPVKGLGDGDTSPDAAVSGNNVLLRAERAGNGNGRVYVVNFTARKGQGPSCSGSVKVSVPRDKKDTAVDSGQLYNSFGQ